MKKTFSQDLKRNLLKQVTDENPDIIIVSGYLTTDGYIHEYNDASMFLDELQSITEIHVIPGNHDARNVGLVHFENKLGRANLCTMIKVEDLQ